MTAIKHEDDDDRHESGKRVTTEADGTPITIPETPAEKSLREFTARVTQLVADRDAGKLTTANVTKSIKTIAAELGGGSATAYKWRTLKELGGAEWFEMAPPRRRWLLEDPGLNDEGEKSTGVVPLSKVGMLAAAGAAGKTMALVQLALAVATGREWLNKYTTPNPGHVLLALGEEDDEEVRRRLYTAGKLMRLTDEQRKLALERIIVLPLAGQRIALTDQRGEDSEMFGWLKDCLQNSGHEWRLIALDPLSRFAGGDTEKDNAAATAFIEAAETLLKMPGNPAVILAHHITKTARSDEGDAKSVNAARGASALTDGARWVANLEPFKSNAKLVWFALSKTNYGIRTKPTVLVREDGGALRAETEAECTTRMAAEEAQARDQQTKGTKAAKAPSNGASTANAPDTGNC